MHRSGWVLIGNCLIVKTHLGNEVEIHEYDAVFGFVKKLSDEKKVSYFANKYGSSFHINVYIQSIALDPAKCNMKLFASVADVRHNIALIPRQSFNSHGRDPSVRSARRSHTPRASRTKLNSRACVKLTSATPWRWSSSSRGWKMNWRAAKSTMKCRLPTSSSSSEASKKITLAWASTLSPDLAATARSFTITHTKTCAPVTTDKLLLLDSGAQYRHVPTPLEWIS